MKWHKIPSTWRQSETFQILKEEFGREGPMLFLEIIQIIASEIQEDKDIDYLYKNGWKKPLKEWCRLLGLYPKKFKRFIKHLEMFGKCTTKTQEIFLYLNIHQVREFIDERAISSSRRHNTGTQLGPNWDPREEKRREEKKEEPGVESITPSSTSGSPPPIGIRNFLNQWDPELHTLAQEIIAYWNLKPKVLEARKPIRIDKWFKVFEDRKDLEYWKRAVDNFVKDDWHKKTRHGLDYLITKSDCDAFAAEEIKKPRNLI